MIITSATIDPERFSRHFDDAPVIEVSGRTYPVEVRYRPLLEDSDDPEDPTTEVRDQPQAICDAVRDRGADALAEYAERFDGVVPPSFRVPAEVLGRCAAGLDADVRAAFARHVRAPALHTVVVGAAATTAQ